MGVLLAVVAGSAAWCWSPPKQPAPHHSGVGSQSDPNDGLQRWRFLVAAGSILAGWVVLGGAIGLIAGAIAAAVSWRTLSRAETRAQREERECQERDAPLAIRLLAASLASGAALPVALDQVAASLGGPTGRTLRRLRARSEFSPDQVAMWQEVADDGGPFAGLGACCARTLRSGSSIASSVRAHADDLSRRAGAQASAGARRIGVRATAPLGVCFLPAFMVLGVVPLVAGIVGSMDLFG